MRFTNTSTVDCNSTSIASHDIRTGRGTASSAGCDARRAAVTPGSPRCSVTSLRRHAPTTAKHVPTCPRSCRVARLADRLTPAHTKPAHTDTPSPTLTHSHSSIRRANMALAGRHASMRYSRPSVARSREARLGVEAIHTCSPLAEGSRSKWRNSRGSRALLDAACAESPRPSGWRDAAPSPLGRQVDGRE